MEEGAEEKKRLENEKQLSVAKNNKKITDVERVTCGRNTPQRSTQK